MVKLFQRLPVCLGLGLHLSLVLSIFLLFFLSLGHECQWIVIVDVSATFSDSAAEEIIFIVLISECLLYLRATSHSKVVFKVI